MIVIGKAFYLFMWGFLVVNLVYPYVYPANIFCYIALAAMLLLHGLQAILFSSTLTTQEKAADKYVTLRFFLFGVFEMLSIKKRQKEAKNSNVEPK